MRCLMNASAAATVVKNVASFGAFLFRLAAGKRAIMLDEASIITAMRRPGNDTSSRVMRRERIGQRHHEEGHAREEQQQRAVANERGREECRPAAPFEHCGQRHLRPPGLARVSARPARTAIDRPPITTSVRMAMSRWRNSSVGGARVAPLEDRVARSAWEPALSGPRAGFHFARRRPPAELSHEPESARTRPA